VPGDVRQNSMDNPAYPSFYGSRLVHLLSGFKPAGAEAPGRHFADRFGQLVGLPGSISLSMAHADLSAMTFQPEPVAAADVAKSVREEFLRVRMSLVRAIAVSFDPAVGRNGSRLPTPEGLYAHFELTGVFAAKRPGRAQNHAAAFEPYRKFYVARQRNLEIRIQQLRAHIGAAISGLSAELAQLSKLDASLENALSGRSRDLFAVVPKLLELRFGERLDLHRQALAKEPEAADLERWLQPGGWIGTFCGEMRELLIAELEVRLQPVLGMLESLPETSAADRSLDKGKYPDRD
jgi:hypothetical protein